MTPVTALWTPHYHAPAEETQDTGMSRNVIDLQAARAKRLKLGALIDRGPDSEPEVWLRDFVLAGACSGRFRGHECGIRAALEDHFLATFAEFVPLAEAHFEGVYRFDPYNYLSYPIETYAASG